MSTKPIPANWQPALPHWLGDPGSLMHLSCDRDGLIRSWSRECEARLGYSSTEIVGRVLWQDLFSKEPSYHDFGDLELEPDQWIARRKDADPLVVKILTIDEPSKTGRGNVNIALVDIHSAVLVRHNNELIHRVVSLLSLNIETGAILKLLLETICDAIGFEIGELWIPDEMSENLHCAAVFSVADGSCETFVRENAGISFPVGEGIPGRVWRSHEIEWHEALTSDSSTLARADSARKAGLQSAVGVPILHEDRTVQCILLFMTRRKRPYSKRVVDMLAFTGRRMANLLTRLRMEEELRINEERYRDISSLTSDVFYSYMVHPDGSMDLDWLSGELQGVKERFSDHTDEFGIFTAICDPRDRGAILERLARLKAGETDTREIRVIDVNGDSRWLRLVGIPKLDGNGRLQRITGAASDIHARKTAELELIRSTQEIGQHLRERESLYNTVALLSKRDNDLKEQDFSVFTEFVRETFPGSSRPHVLLELDGETYRTRGFKPSGVCLKDSVFTNSGNRIVLEAHFEQEELTGSDEERWQSLLPQFTSHLASAVDKRDFHREQSEDVQRYKLLMQSQADLVSRVTVDGQRLFVNDAYCRFCGFSRDEMLKTNVWTFVAQADIPKIRENFSQLTKHRPWRSYVASQRRWDGEWRFVEWTMHGTFRDGRLHEVLGVGKDVTDRVVTERALEEANLAMIRRQLMLERVHRHLTMSELGAGIAHQMNQPLNAVANYLEASRQVLTAQSGSMKERLKAVVGFIDRAQGQVMRTGRMIREINEFLRSPAQYLEKTDLNDLCRQCAQLARPNCEMNGISLETSLCDTPLMISVVPVEVEQVLLCNLFNAIESYSIDKTASGRFVRLSTHLEDDGAVVRITDAGQGLPENVAPEQLFEALFSTKQQGQGMGLAIAKAIVERHSGKISIANRREGGVQVKIWFPTLN